MEPSKSTPIEHGHVGHECNGCNADLPLASQSGLQDDPEEHAHLENVCDSFRQYATFARCARSGYAKRIQSCPESQRRLLPLSMQPGTPEAQAREAAMQEAEVRNQFLLDMVLRHAGLPTSQEALANARVEERVNAAVENKWSSDADMSKVTSVLKSLARDWSAEGENDRKESYQPIIDGFTKYLPVACNEPAPRLVVPGAGVGRLALELSSRKYQVQGNEFSLQMLLASDFILNGGSSPSKAFAISPYLTETRNVCSSTDPSRKIMIPDVEPVAMLQQSSQSAEDQSSFPDFSMAAGDFISIYQSEQERGMWDGVASCFFLDTAPCVVQYLRTIHNMLKDDGLLINFGPLLWHFSGPPLRPDDILDENYRSRNSHLDRRYLESIDMSYEDVRDVLGRVGFDIVEETMKEGVRYTADPKSLMQTNFRCVYFVAKKRRQDKDSES